MSKPVRRPLPLEIALRLVEEGIFGEVDLRNAFLTELRTVCPGCRLRPDRPKPKPAQVERDFARLAKLAGKDDWDGLEAMIREKQPRRQSHPDLAARLVEAARDALPGEPDRSDRWARAALLVAGAKETVEHRGRAAQALAFRANAARIRHDLDSAEGFLRQARGILAEAGTYELVVMADVDRIEGLLHRQRRQFEPAVDLLQRAAGTYARAGDMRLTARALNSLAMTYSYAALQTAATSTGFLALELADVVAEPRLRLDCRLNLGWYQFFAGETAAAQERLAALRDDLEDFGDRGLRLRHCWLEARLMAENGEHDRARNGFWAAYHGFVDSGCPYEAIQVALSLAAMESRTGQTERLRAIAAALGRLQEDDGLGTQLQQAARTALAEVRAKLDHGSFLPALARHLERQFLFVQLDPSYSFAA